uniref:Mitochondrial import receptor subunit TOM5 homolog isoform X1 n=1 Tax=Geotrypetes seraphini TaxID=260995 RepID=A0A6P8NQW4_GEOSA|nr:mitochondrial import receptor subunit TOM5 homolog isoform X1 [Geotrypetes seraphini]
MFRMEGLGGPKLDPEEMKKKMREDVLKSFRNFFVYVVLLRVSTTMSTRKCVNNPNVFCYICGNYTVLKQRTDIMDFVKKAYYLF